MRNDENTNFAHTEKIIVSRYMQNVLIAGAGKSSSCLIEYMLQHAGQQWKVVVADANPEAIAEKINGHPKGEAAILDIHNESSRQALVRQADIVISILPPLLHNILAKDCILFKKNLITSSYVSDEIKALDADARKAGILFMCEMGLDPGIDHMSANAIIHSIERIAGTITSFKSFCGGLVAPESDDNPWHYKISWNPRNIVMAGSQGAVWLENGREHHAAYNSLFSGSKKIKVNHRDIGSLSYYPNRDSLKYLNLYHLPGIRTFMRATLRHPAFMKGWDTIVRSGLTNDQDVFNNNNYSYTDWLAQTTGLSNDGGLKAAFAQKYAADEKVMRQMEWLGLFDHRKIYENKAYSSGDLLQQLLEEKWKMKVVDKDMVVMQHQIEYERKGAHNRVVSSMVAIGENRQYSAMARTVGLPMAILAKKMLKEGGVKNLYGVHIPVMPEVYVPVLKELRKYDIEFLEEIG